MANYSWYTEGRITVINGSADVTSEGTMWLLHARQGDMLAVTNGGPAKELYEILSVESDTKLTLASPYQGTPESGAEYAILRNFTGVWSVAAQQAQEIQDLIKRFNTALRENLRGEQGTAGKDGKTILGGQGAPSSVIGTDSDWYLDMATWEMYRKEGGTWILRGSLRGPKGEPGKDGVQWYYDETPSASAGNIGDINFNGTTGDIHKRTLTGWLQIGNFKGPKGETGPKGDTGTKGDKGDPARWYSGAGAPTVSTGTNGDMYLNSLSGDVYRKASDVWVQQGNVKGRVGDQGPAGPAGLTFKGVWDALSAYEYKDAVHYRGNAWIARKANAGVTPPSTRSTPSNEAWELLAAKGDDGLGSGDMRMAVYDPEGTGVVEKAKQAEHAQDAETAAKAASVPWEGVEDAPLFATPESVDAAISEAQVEVLDTLDSDRTDAALSAAQGQKLKAADAAIVEALNEKAEIEHTHEITDIDGLDDALNNSAAPDMTHIMTRFIANLTVSNWTERSSAANNAWRSVCWSSELRLFCAVATTGTGNRVMTSSDGINWTSRTSAADSTWASVCWSPELHLFCAVASSGIGARVMTSPDGITWTGRTAAAANNWLSVCWSPELRLFCAVAISGTGNRVMTSPDGINWTSRTSAVDNNWYSVCWSPARQLFCAVAESGSGNRVMTSPDGINWIGRTAIASNWVSVCWSPELGLFCAVAVNGTGNRVMTSSDGISWEGRTEAVALRWISVSWSPELQLFCAVAESGSKNRVMTSPDGISWTARPSAEDNNWVSVCWSPELRLFCAVAYTGTENRVMTTAYSYFPGIEESH